MCFFSANERATSNQQYNFTTVSWPGNGKAELKIDNLKKFTKYCIVAQAFNMKGAGPISAEVIAQTLEDGMFTFCFKLCSLNFTF